MRVCRSNTKKSHNNQSRNYQAHKPQSQNRTSSAISYMAASPPGLSRSIRKVIVNGRELDTLFDSGSSVTFINFLHVQKHGWKLNQEKSAPISMASLSHISYPIGYCMVDIHFLGELLSDQKVFVMKDLCADMIIGLDVLGGYKSITIELGGEKATANIAAACAIQIPNLFGELDPSCRAISINPRRYSEPDRRFIKAEVSKLKEQGIVVECLKPNPWRAQVLVHQGNEIHKQSKGLLSIILR